MPVPKTAAEIEAIVRARAEDAGLNSNHVWRDVNRRTHTGRLVLHLLGLPDEWNGRPVGRQANEARHADIESAFYTWQQVADASGKTYRKKEVLAAIGEEFGISPSAVSHSICRNRERNTAYKVKLFLEPELEPGSDGD